VAKTVVLQSLSSVGRSKHAIELEKRAVNLLIEEGILQSDFYSFELAFQHCFSFYLYLSSSIIINLLTEGLTFISTYFLVLFREGTTEDESSECTWQASTCGSSITANTAHFCYAPSVPAIPSPPLK
jgi:hypothetical protein